MFSWYLQEQFVFIITRQFSLSDRPPLPISRKKGTVYYDQSYLA